MINPKYVLIVRGKDEKRLAVSHYCKEPRTGTGHNGVNPAFLRYCRSVFVLHTTAFSIETRSLEGWQPGVDVETLPPVVWVERAEEEFPGALRYGFSFEEVSNE